MELSLEIGATEDETVALELEMLCVVEVPDGAVEALVVTAGAELFVALEPVELVVLETAVVAVPQAASRSEIAVSPASKGIACACLLRLVH